MNIARTHASSFLMSIFLVVAGIAIGMQIMGPRAEAAAVPDLNRSLEHRLSQLETEVNGLEASSAQANAKLEDLSVRYQVHTHALGIGYQAVPQVDCTLKFSNAFQTFDHICTQFATMTVVITNPGHNMTTGPPSK